jgi:hypothetical protein
LKDKDPWKLNIRKLIIVGIALIVAMLHFVIGPDYQGYMKDFITGYLIDVMLPFFLILLIGLFQNRFLQNYLIRGIIVFSIGLTVEVMQYYGYKILGNTADILDLLAYFSGIVLGIVFDHFVLSRFTVSDD